MTEYSVAELEAMLKIARSKEYEKSTKTYHKNSKARELAKQHFEEIVPKIKAYLLVNLKVGDIITCKGYARYKEVIEVKEYRVLALCGWFRAGKFIRSGYSSETMLEHVTGILKDGKIVKVKDLI